MNLTQLELKRTKELLAKVREARHVAQAMRKPLAQYLRFDGTIRRLVNGGIRRVNAIHESSFEEWATDWQPKIEELETAAKVLEKLQRQVEARIKRIKASPALTKPSKPIEERIRARRSKTKREKAKFIQLAERREKLDRDTIAYLVELQRTLETDDARNAAANIERYWRKRDMFNVERANRDFARHPYPQYQAIGKRIADALKTVRELNNESYG